MQKNLINVSLIAMAVFDKTIKSHLPLSDLLRLPYVFIDVHSIYTSYILHPTTDC